MKSISLIILITISSCVNIYMEEIEPTQEEYIQMEIEIEIDFLKETIWNNYDRNVMPFHHSWIVPVLDGEILSLHLKKNKIKKITWIDDCEADWTSTHLFNSNFLEIYVNETCHETIENDNQILFTAMFDIQK